VVRVDCFVKTSGGREGRGQRRGEGHEEEREPRAPRAREAARQQQRASQRRERGKGDPGHAQESGRGGDAPVAEGGPASGQERGREENAGDERQRADQLAEKAARAREMAPGPPFLRAAVLRFFAPGDRPEDVEGLLRVPRLFAAMGPSLAQKGRYQGRVLYVV
jgi:hypothetical protein